MNEKINFGIGFISGRPNVCNIINRYYKDILQQVEDINLEVSFTFFILYDLNYIHAKREEFYKIDPEVYKYVNIKYLTPEYVIEAKQELVELCGLTEGEADLLIGTGYAKARNSILYEAVKNNIDYLLFWDDDEYPLAALRDGNNIKWLEQKNVLQHLKSIENSDVTCGYRCGLMNPLPFVEYNDIVTEQIYKQFIEAIENDVISWNKLQYMIKNESGIEYADEGIALGTNDAIELKNIGVQSVLYGSGMCLNLRHLDKIPAFYNPPGARGEDTFFSCSLADMGAKVLRIPAYHFHDGFLKYKFLMDNKYPSKLRKVTSKDSQIEARFLKTTIGWTRYKPLLFYILDKDTYKQKIEEADAKLKMTTPSVSTAFKDCDLTCLSGILEEYDSNVEKHYKEYMDTRKIWNKVKKSIIKNKETVNAI